MSVAPSFRGLGRASVNLYAVAVVALSLGLFMFSETWRGNNRTLKFRAHDKLRALTLLSQYLGLLDGVGRQVDPAGMVARMRAAAAQGTDSMPQSVENITETEEEEGYES